MTAEATPMSHFLNLFRRGRRRLAGAQRVVAMGLLLGCCSQCSSGELGTLKVGGPAPQFVLTTLKGDQVKLKSLTEKGVVLVNFWASWCAPCKEEVPLLNKLHRKYRDRGITI